MPFRDQYQAQVRLLMRLIPIVARETCFALKGGTAINLFVRDLPRLSVDIDLMYLPMHERSEALVEIDAAMKRIKTSALADLRGARVTENVHDGAVLRLLVMAEGTQVKIEVSPVLRGVVHEPFIAPVTEAVEEVFGFAETNVVSFEDLFAGKLVAALDRQHPRDLFDVRGLLTHEGLSDELREAFIIYLLSHNRPMGEVLSGRVKDLANEYRNGFEGMTEEVIAIEELIKTQHEMIKTLIGGMPDHHRAFLIGFELGEPDWSLLRISHVAELPAIRWRQRNLDKLNPDQRSDLVELLRASLERRTK
ncbi:nucleotidyl transferase AbiEii/AbiGii toxin family protein [Agrobacterium sp. CMT1]|jgi:predicted nucleotidyltransferase component of viral defense system|uniref:nucleotidyl transferase AbiEii/AbiGii toxin family protein n=1 Tax=Agrobacterium TaxID=357 RepID=UPI00088B941E|nr:MULTISPECIES: nucleotidyl transferase AbiEii/AbiGii toxin family protein [Agrobacterium]MBM7321876.1 nucleotidyl transferase AbiEii/AbiGii toxin family protein [Agrobacterium sp. S2]MBW9061099.1 nucleotidyl transferase AbiEii/AbiGii toxin family protein [Agrobacterium pusense]MBW9080527.1 nucleotidyl transferase AbiEii/AbiGii toxin family protein [Agrobacterium pusense]MCW8279292.1 nucleotidyl transferase AbiEii/AbiGii toxin family protein [Agrobacterium sp. InxBP2]MDR6192442.1 putative nuc